MTESIRVQPAAPLSGEVVPPAAARTRVPGLLAIAGIGGGTAIMLFAALVRNTWAAPSLVMPAIGPPFELPVHAKLEGVVTGWLWIAVALAAGGLIAGLVAARRGARPPMRLLLAIAAAVIALLAVVPPAGSTDALDYATYGRLVLLGHSPYVTTPEFLRLLGGPFGHVVPWRWRNQVSLYGPFATLEQYVAALLGGTSMAIVTFWLKLWNAVAFGAVAWVLDRLLRGDPAARLRAHLLWTLNPLLLWDVIESGHVDALAAAAGLAGVLALGRQSDRMQVRLSRAVAAGALVGIAAGIKINYALFGIAVAWALRRSPKALLAAAAAGLAVLVPSYAWLGRAAITALFHRVDIASPDSFYRLFVLGSLGRHLALIAGLMFVVLALLLLRYLPAGDRTRPALRPAVALCVAWVFVWPYTLPWYDAMILCVLVLFPASRLDWLVIARLAVGTVANIPGNPVPPHGLHPIDWYIVHEVTPLVMLACLIGVAALAISGHWGTGPPRRRGVAARLGRKAPAPAG